MAGTNGNSKKNPFTERSITTSLLVDALRKTTDTATYAELSAACGIDVKGNRSSLYSAMRIMLRQEGVLFVTVRNSGVKRATASEAVACGLGSIGRVHNEVKRGVTKLASADISKLDNEEKVRFNAAASILGALNLMTQNKSVKRLEVACTPKQDKLTYVETLTAFSV